jgi:hypothetical protein
MTFDLLANPNIANQTRKDRSRIPSAFLFFGDKNGTIAIREASLTEAILLDDEDIAIGRNALKNAEL